MIVSVNTYYGTLIQLLLRDLYAIQLHSAAWYGPASVSVRPSVCRNAHAGIVSKRLNLLLPAALREAQRAGI